MYVYMYVVVYVYIYIYIHTHTLLIYVYKFTCHGPEYHGSSRSIAPQQKETKAAVWICSSDAFMLRLLWSGCRSRINIINAYQ